MTILSVVFRKLTREQVDSLLFMTKKLGHERLVMSARENEADFEGLFKDWASLLDAIELSLGDEAVFDRAHELVKGRFAIAEKYGLTVEFTGMPASGATH